MGILRYLLAMSVLFAHCGNNMLLPANYAVEAFYIISGFYMTLILNEKYVGKNSYKVFITKRFFRLAPTYWAICLVTLLVVLGYTLFSISYPPDTIVFNPHRASYNTSVVTWISIFTSNIIMLGQDIALFFGVNPNSGNIYFTVHSYQEAYPLCRYFIVPQAWSIGLEILFYLIAPFIVRRKTTIVCAILILSLSIKLFIKYYLKIDDGNWTFRFFPSEIMFFCLGCLSYKLYTLYSEKFKINKKYLIYIVIVFLATIYMRFPLPYAIQYPMLILVITLLVAIAFSNFKNSKSDRIIGELSYPIYLSHSVVIMFFYQFNCPFLLNAWFIGFITTLFSLFLYYYIICPSEKIRSKIKFIK